MEPLVDLRSRGEHARRLCADSEAVRAHLAALVTESHRALHRLSELRVPQSREVRRGHRRARSAPVGVSPPVTDAAERDRVADLLRDERLC